MSTAYSFSKEKKTPSFVKFDKEIPAVGSAGQWSKTSKIKSVPSVKVGNQSRVSKDSSEAPGPGTYEVKSRIIESNGVSLKGSHKMSLKTQGPSPAQYSPSRYENSKKYTFPKFTASPLKIIGPNSTTYNPIKMEQNVVNHIFDKSDRDIPDKRDWLKNVGPGIYQPQDKICKPNVGIYSFPKKQKFQDDVIEQSKMSKVPGPGNYDVSSLRKIYKTNVFSKAARSVQLKTEVPPVGQYDTHSQFNRHSGTIIGKEIRTEKYDNKVPGPGSYQLVSIDNLKKRNSSIRFAKSKRVYSEASDASKIGPGKYQVLKDSSFSQAGKAGFTIRGKFYHEKIQDTPGPQKYNPDYRKNTLSCEKATIGNERRLSARTSDVPGPGNYKCEEKIKTQSFYFDRSKRGEGENKMRTTLGPGQYNVKPLIGEPYASAKNS